MPVQPPRLSVCIPSYNRVEHLAPLLDSIFAQEYTNSEVVICEDRSPQRERIRAVAAEYAARYPGRVRYHENAENLGYDANFREMLRRATGEYCFIMGNDDLVAPGALGTVADALRRHPNVGVVLRSFSCFSGAPENVTRVSRHFAGETLFAAGPETVAAFFRRLVVMSGIVLHRAEAVRHETSRFDGTLFYQQYLAAHLLMRMNGLFLPQVLAYVRENGIPEFGTSERERGLFTPGSHPPETDRQMLRGLLAIARHADETYGAGVYARIHRDFGNYMYPTLAKQAHQPLPVFVRFYRDLAAMGFWRYPLFHGYAAAILILGTRRVDRVIAWVRRSLGHTPVIGRRPRAAIVAERAG
jgi:glycosyltransferase involved in cell wall biosynthesis